LRIISKFHDYYDVAQREGQDRSLVFVRHREDLPEPRNNNTLPPALRGFADFAPRHSPGNLRLGSWSASRHTAVRFGMVLFAGKLYPFAEVSHIDPIVVASAPVFVYERDELAERMREVGYDLDAKDRRDARHNAFWNGEWASSSAFFALSGSDCLAASCVAGNLSCAVWERSQLTVNPRLADYQLYRRLDAWQAFQELSMFLGNIAAPDRTPVTVADQDRIVQHGFDRWSFRKRPAGG
jgi:hypothetical protein